MSAITRTITISIREMAHAFCEMNGCQQAEFFNEIAEEVRANWDAPFSAQVKFIYDAENLTPEGRKIMESFKHENQI